MSWSDKFRSWNRARKYPYDPLVEESNYFRICHDTPVIDNSIMEIELLRGPYQGIRVCITDLQIVDEESGKATFDIQVPAEYNNSSFTDFDNDKRFQKIISDVFHIILENAITNYTGIRKEILRDDVNEESREDYIEEPVEQRTVRKKGSAVSKRGISTGKKRKNSVRGDKKLPPKV